MSIQKIVSLITLSATLLQGSMEAAMPDKAIGGSLFLVNRDHMVSEHYVPVVRTVNVVGMRQSMKEEAAAALEEMFAAASQDNAPLSSVSGYRSFTKQSTIYARKQKTAGQKTAEAYVAIPGASEHQLGVAMDVTKRGGSNLNAGFGKTKAGLWIAENAWRYGFIVRYLEGEESVTGYAYEPWHVRYVGKEHAKAIYESGVPMEIYVSVHRLAVYDFLIKQTDEVLP